MVDSIPVNYANYYQYGMYNNTNSGNGIPYDTISQNATQPIQQDSYQPQFAGSQPEEKKGKGGKIILTGLLIGGAYLLGRNWKAVSKWVKGLFNKGGEQITKTQQKTQELINKHANKVQTQKTSTKHIVKNTSPNKNPKPVSNAREAEIIENINLSHVNANTRNLVEKASAGTVTPAQQKAYDKAIAYQAPNAKQKIAIDELHAANAAQRAELNSIAHNSKGSEGLNAVKAGIKAEANVAKTVSNGSIRHANGNIYHIENGAVTRVELYQNGVKNTVELTDPKKIAKHLAKHNVNTADFVQPKSVNLVA